MWQWDDRKRENYSFCAKLSNHMMEQKSVYLGTAERALNDQPGFLTDDQKEWIK